MSWSRVFCWNQLLQKSLTFFFFPLTWARSRWSLRNKLNRREQKEKKWKSLQIKIDPEKTINWPFVCRQHMLKKSMVGSCGKSQNNCRQSWPKGENSQADEERRLPGTWRTKDAKGNVWNLRPPRRDVAYTHGFCEGNEKKMHKCHENVFNYQLLVDTFLDKSEYILFAITVGIRKR